MSGPCQPAAGKTLILLHTSGVHAPREGENETKNCTGKGRCQMALEQIVKATVAVAAAGIIALVGMELSSMKVYADDQDSDQNLAAIGLKIAPPFINMKGKDPTLVGLGSYIVNALSDCNGCHGSD